MPVDLPGTFSLERDALESLIRGIVVELLRELLPGMPLDRQNGMLMPTYYLVSSVHPDDLLNIVEAPDVTAGERNEPHWRTVQDIRRGDRIIFRDSAEKAVVGMAVADHTEKGRHRHAPHKHAIRWWLTQPERFEVPVSDEDFRQIFLEHDDGSAGFKLIRNSGQFSQKTYTYPLNLETAEAVLTRAGMLKSLPGTDHGVFPRGQ